MRGSTIISIEDSDTDFFALQHALHVAGVTNPIERYESGRSAAGGLLSGQSLSLADKASLIMLDLNLPGIDGRELLRKVRALDPARAVPIIVLTTSSHPKDIDSCYRAGADAYMVKPLELEDWETKVGVLAQTWLRGADDTRKPAEIASGDAVFSVISRIIEGEIIPRLLLTHALPVATHEVVPEGRLVGEEEVAELTRLLLTQDLGVACAYVETIRSQGVALGSLYLSLLAPAAQLVGDWWRADRCRFTDVLLVLSRLQTLLRDYAPAADAQTRH